MTVVCHKLPQTRCQNETLPKNVQKVSQNAFWGFLAASQKNVQKVSGKCPGAGAGAGKMSRKCQKSVPQTFSRHFFDTFWQIESQKGARARAKRARPLLGGGRRPPPLFAKKQFFDQFFGLGWAGLGWPGSSPRLAQVKPWAGPGSSPGLGPGQALEKLVQKIGRGNGLGKLGPLWTFGSLRTGGRS